MAHCRFLFDNTRFDDAALSAFSASPSLPVKNVQDQMRTKVYHSATVTANEYIRVDFGATAYFNALVIINHNFTEDALITIKAGTSAGDDSLLHQTFNAIEPMLGFGEGGFGMHGFGGYLTDAEIAKYMTDPTRIIYLDDAVTAQYVEIAFSDIANPNGYLEIGRIFLCEAVESPRMPKAPLKFLTVDPSQITKSGGGVKWTDKKKKYRTITLLFDDIPPDAVWWGFADMIYEVGLSDDFITDLSLDESGAQDLWIGVLYGRLAKQTGVDLDTLLWGKCTLPLEESL